MTTTTTVLPLLLPLLVLLLSSSASSRPCKTIFFFSSTTSSTPLNPNSNPHSITFFLIPKPHSTRLPFDPTRPTRLPFDSKRPTRPTFDSTRAFDFMPRHAHHQRSFDKPDNLPFEYFPEVARDGMSGQHHEHHGLRHHRFHQEQGVFDVPEEVPRGGGFAMRERTRDIMSVVGALVFGMGCGALTAATMYLFWSLFTPNRLRFEESDEEEEEFVFDDDLDNTKKMAQNGYVAVPTTVVDDQAKQGE